MGQRSGIETFGLLMWGAVVVLGGALAFGPVSAFVAGDAGSHSQAPLTVEDTTTRGTTELDAQATRENVSLATDEAAAYAESAWGVPVTLDVDLGAPAVNLGVTLPSMGVSVRNVGHPHERQSVELESDAIGGPAADTGLCMVGLDRPNPSGLLFDVSDGRVNATIDPDPTGTPTPSGESAQDVVERCSNS